MIIIAVLILLFGLFFFLKKHVGPAHLAVIAGISVYESFGRNIVDVLHKAFSSAPDRLLEVIVFMIFVIGLPMLLYLRSSKGGIFGILRIIEAALFSTLLVSLSAWCISYFIPFDELGNNILKFIDSYKGIIMVAGIAFAYFDILMYRDEY